MPLTDTRLRALKPRARLYRIADRDGLCIEVRPTGARLWRFRYRLGGKAQMVGLGEYPAVTLQGARQRVQAERARVARGEDPAAIRRAQRHAHAAAGDDSFKAMGEAWHAQQVRGGWSAQTADKHKRMLEAWAYPYIGRRSVRVLTAADLRAVVSRPDELGKVETAHRLKQDCSRIFRYAISKGLADADPTSALTDALTPVNVEHHASLKAPAEVGALLRAIDGYTGHGTTRAALRLAPLVFVRPGELRKARWEEFDLEKAEWRIPSERMKKRRTHLVPLSRQAVRILEELEAITGEGAFVFPGLRPRSKPISENTLNAALRRLGYGNDEMTAHGFRSIASTMLHEAGFNTDWIEAQLAHLDSSVRGDYNFALYLQDRRKMMQAWADMLDELRAERKVIKLRA